MPLEQTRPQIVRYFPGNYYHLHRDNSGELYRRYVSVVCYLNDNFEGGSTYFPEIDLHVRPTQGSAILFNSNRLHAGSTVTSGVKYVLVLWLLGPELPLRSFSE
jgi:Rps23 Pro-64 3,4-dihydroxylase Tpa1-like proline 4-hydroxylase